MCHTVAVEGYLKELNDFLLDMPLFAAHDEVARLELAKQLEPVHVAAGNAVLRQGDPGHALFLLVSGRLQVSVATDGTERVLHHLGRGAVVGRSPCSVTGRGLRPCARCGTVTCCCWGCPRSRPWSSGTPRCWPRSRGCWSTGY